MTPDRAIAAGHDRRARTRAEVALRDTARGTTARPEGDRRDHVRAEQDLRMGRGWETGQHDAHLALGTAATATDDRSPIATLGAECPALGVTTLAPRDRAATTGRGRTGQPDPMTRAAPEPTPARRPPAGRAGPTIGQETGGRSVHDRRSIARLPPAGDPVDPPTFAPRLAGRGAAGAARHKGRVSLP